jgi:hypothetical protein
MKQTQPRLAKQAPTLFLRAALLGVAGLAGFLGAVVLWSVQQNWNPEFPDLIWLRYPVLVGLAVALMAFFVAAAQAWRLLNYVDKNKPFSKDSIRALRNIKWAALLIGAVFMCAMPLVYWIAQSDDAPGLILFGLLFAGIPLAVGVFAGVLESLIQKALDLKAENDLTV